MQWCRWAKLKRMWPLLLILSVLTLRFLLKTFPSLAELYSTWLFPLLSLPWLLLNRILPLSLGFILVLATTLLGAFALMKLFYLIFQAIRQKSWAGLRRFAYLGLALFSVLLTLYFLMHGFHYLRPSLAQRLQLDLHPRQVEDLEAVTRSLMVKASEARRQVPTKADGQLEEELSRAAYLRLADESPLSWTGVAVRPKLVPLSHYWSYTETTGMYMPFVAEANVNALPPIDEFLFTALHEIAHVRGIAREDEANFWAYYTGIRHSNSLYRYAAHASAYLYCRQALWQVAPERAEQLDQEMPTGLRLDLGQRHHFWKQYEGAVAEAANQVNDQFLKANGEDRGVQSYGEVVDLLLAYELSEQNGKR